MTIDSVSGHYCAVRDFMRKIAEGIKNGGGQNLGLRNKPEMGTLGERTHRANLILEEVLELIRDGLGLDMEGLPQEVDFKSRWKEIGEGDMVQMVDGVFDTKVVVTGTLVHFGVPDVYGQYLVDKNNLDKFGVGHRYEGLKLVKPPGHQPPPLKEWLEEVSYLARSRGKD